MEEWLVDGYNLLHRLKNVPREKLFQILANFAASRNLKVTLVLDGKGQPDDFAAFKTAQFQIIYSQNVSADSWIERYVCEKKSGVVVTEDRAISNMARGSGARVIKAAEFVALIEEVSKERGDVAFKTRTQSHGFHRPFDDKLKKFLC